MNHYVLNLSGKWVTAQMLDQALVRTGNAHASNVTSVRFNILSGCGIMMDAAPQLLSLVNQLAHRGRTVTLKFEQGMTGAMSYLDRAGFFDHLLPGIRTIPERPKTSGAKIYRRNNQGLVEFMTINPAGRDDSIPTTLADALENACSRRADKSRLGAAAGTVFSELINNVYDHSETPINGYAALQVYKGEKAFVVVSDSGQGLLNTLKPTLSGQLARLSDPDLIVYMLNEGISRLGPGRGAGLLASAQNALRYDAKLHIHLPTASFKLVPVGNGYQARAYSETDLPLIHGTHINFEFALDNFRDSG